MEHTINGKVIIDSCGTYKTRDGRTVNITQIGDPKYTFNYKGDLIKKVTKKGRQITEWNIWHRSGAYVACGIHPLDIVEKL